MSNPSTSPIRFVFFGGEPLGVPALEALETAGLLPSLVVCNPDRPVGRKQVLTPPPVKVWAEQRAIEVWQPESYKGEAAEAAARASLAPLEASVFVVVAYNFILPDWLLKLPTHGTLNLHPSLLPKYRGASPIRSAILADDRDHIGVSVMLLDEQMDHGPLLAQESVTIPESEWPIDGRLLDDKLAAVGGRLLADTLPAWVAGLLSPQPQAHDAATYCGKLTKAMGELTINPHHLPTSDEAYQALLKIRGLAGFPGTFFMHLNKRVKIISASIENDSLNFERVIPEGKAEQSFAQFIQSLHE